jgi:ribosomal protein S18 acetylase RimI-like enzyme
LIKMVSPASLNNLDEIVAVHKAAFPGFFMTQLGLRFLKEYYRCVVECGYGILLVEKENGLCLGFVAGFTSPAAFYQELSRRRGRLAIAVFSRVAARPWRLPILIANYRRTREGARPKLGASTAELSSIAVLPSVGGRGVGSRLVCEFIEAAKIARMDRIMLTTDAYDNESGNRFYKRLGFVCARTFEVRRGRWLNEYVLDVMQVNSPN